MSCSFCLKLPAAWMHSDRAACDRCSALIMRADYPKLATIAVEAKLRAENIPLQGPEEEGYRIALGLGFKAQMVLWAQERIGMDEHARNCSEALKRGATLTDTSVGVNDARTALEPDSPHSPTDSR